MKLSCLQVESIAKADLNSLNDFIGNKKFLLGDKVCDEDAALFGMLSQLVYHDRTFLHNYLKGESSKPSCLDLDSNFKAIKIVSDNCPNLTRYVETMKQTYWPDWNERVKEKSQ